MDTDFQKEEHRISEEINRLWTEMQDTSTLGVSMAISKEAQTTLIKVVNPVIFTPEHRISILGDVFVVSLLECKKVVQGRYSTPGVNRFPKIVEDIIKTGDSPELSKMGRLDTRAARNEISNLQLIYISKPEQAVVFLTSVNPIVSVSEYTIDGRHTSGVPLRAQRLPLVIKSDMARTEFTSASGVKISDSRIEQHSVIDLDGPEFILRGVQDNIITTKKQSRERLGDIVAIASIISIAFGIASFLIRRGRLLEIGVPVLILGIAIFWTRYFSDWGKEYFTPREIEISGEAPMEISFWGELE